jgi:hypothetical protein
MPESQDDTKAMKHVREALRGLEELDKQIQPVVRALPKRDLDAEKARRASKTLLAFIARYETLRRFRGSDKLTPAARGQVEWMNKLLDAFADIEAPTTLARKQAKLKAAEKYDILVKTATRIAIQVQPPPRGASPLIKELRRGVDPAGPLGPLIPLLPLALLLAKAQILIDEALSARPRYP